MFKTRLISGIILVILAFVTIYLGGPVLWATCLLISLIGQKELYSVLKMQKTPLAIAGFAATGVYYILLLLNPQIAWKECFFIAALVLIMFVYVFSFPKFVAEQVTMTYFGIVYVAVMLSCIYQTRILPGQGLFLVGLVFLSSWGCDTCAYCAGMLLGKHKMVPRLSPKKTIEGGVGGLLGAALLGALYALAIGKWGSIAPSPAAYAGICFAGGIISMVGDLAASAIKRNHEIKDYGTLIPGHGGILDRFDSVIFTAPVIYYLSVYFLGL